MHQGQKLREIRKEKGIKLKDIAASMGVSESTINYYEKTENLEEQTLKRYCTLLNISYDDTFNTHLASEPDVPYNQTHIGKKINTLRLSKKIKVQDFAEKMGYASRQSVYMLEKNSELDLLTIKKVANALEVDIKELIKESAIGKITTSTIIADTKSITELEKELAEKNKYISELQQKVIALQDEIIKLKS